MRNVARSLGWELTAFLVLAGALALALAIDSQVVLAIALGGFAIVTPLVLLSFVVRAIAASARPRGAVRASRSAS